MNTGFNYEMILLLLFKTQCGKELNDEQKKLIDDLSKSLIDEDLKNIYKDFVMTTLITSDEFYTKDEFDLQLEKYSTETLKVQLEYDNYLKVFKNFYKNFNKKYKDIFNELLDLKIWIDEKEETISSNELLNKIEELYKKISFGFGGDK